MQLDINTLTLDELDELSDVYPDAIDQLMGGKVTLKVMKGCAWLIRRRDDPEFTIEQAGALTLGDFALEDPKEGNGLSA